MPAFDTPGPISVTLELGVANVRFAAADRTDTTVDVRPTDPNDESDVKAAQQVRVDYGNGTLHVTGPRVRAFDFSRKTRSVDVTVELPTDSRVSADVQVGDYDSAGTLGESRFKTSAGNIRLDHTGALRLQTGAGHVSVEGSGNTEVTTGTGKVRLGAVEGTAMVKNSNGDTAIAAAGGDVRIRSANGDIAVDHAGAGVDAKTSNGAIRLGEIVRGSVTLGTSMGDLEIGIAEGTAAWLQVNTGFGHVRNLLEAAGKPATSDETVEVRGHTSYGDVTIRRA